MRNLLRPVRQASRVWHHATHRHTVLIRDPEQIIICAQRWPGRKAKIFYRPHRFRPWVEWTIQEFERTMGQCGWGPL